MQKLLMKYLSSKLVHTMHTRLLCLWVLGIVSAADDQTQRPVYIISQNGSPPGYSNGLPFFGEPVSSNSVKVLPNAYEISQGVEPSGGGNDKPVSVPVIVNNNTPFQGNVNQPIPVPVSYPDEGSAPTEGPQPAYGTNPIPIRKNSSPNETPVPVPVLVKASESAYRSVVSTPSPFVPRKSSNEETLANPYSIGLHSFRLWPKLPEPVPVPVLTADAFVRNSYRNLNTNLVPNYLRKIPVPVKPSNSLLNRYQQIEIPRYPQNNQIQTQSSQPANQGPIYIIVPRGNNNAQFGKGGYQSSTQNQASYQPLAPQSENQGFFILASPGSNTQSNQAAYQNDGYSSNQAFYGNQQQSQSERQSPQNFAIIGPLNVPGSQYQGQSGQQSPFNYAVFAPSNVLGTQPQAQSSDQQSALKYAIFGPMNAAGSLVNSAGQSAPNYAPVNTLGNSANSVGQSPQNFAVFNPSNGGSQVQPGQSPFTIAVFPSNTGSGFSSSTPSPTQYNSYSTAQSPSPQYVGYSSTPSPNYSGYSTNQSSPQYVGYSTQSPQYVGYSSTPSPTQQPTYSQSTPVSRVSFSGAGGSYNYSI